MMQTLSFQTNDTCFPYLWVWQVPVANPTRGHALSTSENFPFNARQNSVDARVQELADGVLNDLKGDTEQHWAAIARCSQWEFSPSQEKRQAFEMVVANASQQDVNLLERFKTNSSFRPFESRENVMSTSEQHFCNARQSAANADWMYIDALNCLKRQDLVGVDRCVNRAFRSKDGSKAVQEVVVQGLKNGDATLDEVALLATRLQGRVREASFSKHANYLVQKLLDDLQNYRVRFIVEEMQGFVREMACDQIACRALQRAIEQFPCGEEPLRSVIEEVVMATGELWNHKFGSHVVRHILEHGLPQDRRRIAYVLLRLPCIARHGEPGKDQWGTFVVEDCLKVCDEEVKSAIIEKKVADEDRLAIEAADQVGQHTTSGLFNGAGGKGKGKGKSTSKSATNPIQYRR
jgi:hypothetical protein